MEIPVGPFALIRAVIQENVLQTLSGHQLNAEAIEKIAISLSALPVLSLGSRKIPKEPLEAHFEFTI
jgi:Na+/glutamate symporter